MMETITIPSPSAFLSSPVPQPAKMVETKVPVPGLGTGKRKRKTTGVKVEQGGKIVVGEKKGGGVIKPKQSKSRNGCITCKAKRLKCDETKPTCQQCQKRSVACGGYKKDFKWRPFEEATFVNKVVPPKIKRNSISSIKPLDDYQELGSPAPSDISSNHDPGGELDVHMQDTFFHAAAPSPSMIPPQDTTPSFSDPHFSSMPFDMSTPPYLRNKPSHLPPMSFEPDSVTSPLDSLFDANLVQTPPPRRVSGQSPRLIDLLLPGSPLNAPIPSNLNPPIDPQLISTPQFTFDQDPNQAQDGLPDLDIEEIMQQSPLTTASSSTWLVSSTLSPLTSMSHSQGGSASPQSFSFSFSQPSMPVFYQQLSMPAGSPETLMVRFNKQTCGILSIIDGPTENPWRTLIWPLARDSTALYHAIASMTAFHTSKERPSLRVDGIEHMRRSIRALSSSISSSTSSATSTPMLTATALATTLVLAFSESWDQHISTGIEHLRGASILVNQAIQKHRVSPLAGDDLARLRFLANTWVYMDVIARLTSASSVPDTDFSTILSPLFGSSSLSPNENPGPNPLAGVSVDQESQPPESIGKIETADEESDAGNEDSSISPFLETELDPLMGCASSLFPIIGRVASLCLLVRRSQSNSLALISSALTLQKELLTWKPPPPSAFTSPEDSSSNISHALQTAEAYRFATLLYLHQAVPEIPSQSSDALTRQVLVPLATVPESSGLVIVQIWPLMAAGAEVSSEDDRDWILKRWNMMERRMWIGNIGKCREVTMEVWRRKDVWAEEKKVAASARTGLGSRRRTMVDLDAPSAQMGSLGEEFLSFEDMLNGKTMPAAPSTSAGPGMGARRVRAGGGGAAAGSSGTVSAGLNKKKGKEATEMVIDEMEREFTVRGPLHWAGVMKDWNWEILLG